MENELGNAVSGGDRPQKGASRSFALLGEYLTAMKALGKSIQALRDRRNGAGRAIRFLEERGLDILSFTRADAFAYQGSLVERGLSPRTVASSMVALSEFCEYLVEEDLRYDNPARSLPRPVGERTIPWGLPDEKAMEAFLVSLSRFHLEKTLHARKFAFRTHVMAELQYASGLRVEELADLGPEDLDLERGKALVRKGKGRKSRTIYLTAYSVELLRLWLSSRHLVLDGKHDHSRLFGASVSPLEHAYNRDLNAKARASGLSGWSSHRFRHALGFHLLRSGCDIRRIKDILGHERIATTEIYTEVNREDLLEVLDTFHPRA